MQDVFRNAAAGIRDGQLDPVILATNSDSQRAAVRHRMDGVHDQINQHLVHLIAVRQDTRAVGIQLPLYVHIMSGQSLLEDLDAVLNHLLQVDRARLMRFSSGEREQLIHDPRNPLDLGHDRLQPFLDRFLFDAIHQILGAPQNDVHRRADLMGHAGCECAEFGDSLGLTKLGLKPFPFADVSNHGDDGRSFFIDKSGRAHLDIDDRSVQLDDSLIEHGKSRATFQQLLDPLTNHDMAFRMKQIKNRFPQDLLRFDRPEQPEARVIDKNHPIVAIDHDGKG